jgi:hypothetical protein
MSRSVNQWPVVRLGVSSVRIVADIVRDEARGRGYYYHQIGEVDLGGAVGKSRSQSDLSQTNYPAPSGRKITLGQLTVKVNNDTSKVVDENGGPLVAYHGSDEGFDTFLKEKIGSNIAPPNNETYCKSQST